MSLVKATSKLCKPGPRKVFATQRPEPSLVGTCPIRQVDGDGKERGVRAAEPEIVFADFTMRGENRAPHLVRPVGAVQAHAGLLHPRVNSERQAAHQRGNVQKLPAGSHLPPQGPQKANPIEGQNLDEAEGHRVRDIEDGGAFSAPGLRGSCGVVWRMVFVPEPKIPGNGVLESSSDFDQV